jgi:UDP-N-acetylglucosamine acyltransferase
MLIHPSAIVSPKAEFGKDVEIGPYAIVEDHVHVGEGTRLRARAHLCAGTVLGKNCDIHMNAVVGHIPQDFSYKGGPLVTQIGDGVTLRENVTVHGGSAEKPTVIGDKCYLMVDSHVAHNCVLGRNVMLVNSALLAGHVLVEDSAIISGNGIVHQFTRVGRLAMITGGNRVGMDVPPYMISDATNAVSMLNKVGIRRATFLSAEDRDEIKRGFKVLYRSGLDLKEALEVLKADFHTPAVRHWIEFFSNGTPRGFCRYMEAPRRGTRSSSDE